MSNLVVTLLICMSMLTGCGSAESLPEKPPETVTKAEYRKISARQAYEMMSEIKDYIILDVRTEEEYKEGHIDGAVLIPDYEIKARAGQELNDKNAVILVYCRSGRRSADAALELTGMGYVNIYDFGGIIDWPYGTISN